MGRVRTATRRSGACAGSSDTPGAHQAAPILVGGLRRLEYRGYDSAGLATIDRDRTDRAEAGRPRAGCWKSCSRPRAGAGRSAGSATRAGPRTGRPPTATPIPIWAGGRARSSVAVVHNGVIENHAALRRELESQGFAFASQTDTEVIAHLIARELETTDDLFEAVQRALPRLEGTYGLARGQPAGGPARSSGPGSAARWSSGWARASTCWPATRWRSRRTPRGSRSCRTARSSG